jgi:hypothetical protein
MVIQSGSIANTSELAKDVMQVCRSQLNELLATKVLVYTLVPVNIRMSTSLIKGPPGGREYWFKD